MKKLVLILFLAFLVGGLIAAPAQSRDASYYGRIAVDNADIYTGSPVKIQLEFSLYASDKSDRKEMNVPYEFSIFKLDMENSSNLEEEKEIVKKKVRDYRGKIYFPATDKYWRNAQKKMTLTDLDRGYYMGVLKFADHETDLVFLLSDLGITVKTFNGSALVLAQDKKSGDPVSGVEITVDNDKKRYFMGKTDKNGILEIEKIPGEVSDYKSIFILAKKDKQIILSQAQFSKTGNDFKGYLFTDRPIYRPGQKVYFKGVLRESYNGVLRPIKNETVHLVIKDPKSNPVVEKKINTGDQGSISGEFVLGDEPPLGSYSIAVQYNNDTEYGGFKVEEYRKPEYEINVKTAKNFIVGGSKASFDVEAKYYFGAPVADTAFKYTIKRKNYYIYQYYYWWDDFRPYDSGGYIVKSGEGKTDAKGRAKIEFDTEKQPQDFRYEFQVDMVDSSRRKVSGSADVLVTQGQFYINLLTDRYFYSPGDKVKVKINSKTYDGAPVSSPINIVVERIRWSKGKEDKTILHKTTVTTDKEGEGRFEFTPDQVGYITITASAVDKMENKISASKSFYAAGYANYPWFKQSGLEIQCDKPFYAYGEPIKLLISNPYEGTKALVTLEADEIFETRIVDFKNPVEIVTFTAKPEYAPNVYATVSLWKDGEFSQTTKKIIIPAKDKFLNLKITTDKEKYGPRQGGVYTIEAKKETGEPVSCEVALGIADESVYAVSPDLTENIQKFFYGNRYNRVRTASSYLPNYNPIVPPAPAAGVMAEDASPAKVKSARTSAGDGEGLAEPDFVREFFPDTCYFNPSIITDNKGIAIVKILFPDSLTTWRATARAASLKTEVGEATHKVIVTKDLLVRLITPRFLVQRDKSTITAIVHNYLDTPVEAHVSLYAKGVTLKSPEKMVVQIPSQGKVNVDWEISASRAGTAKFTVKALTHKVSDAITLDIPIEPHGVKVVEAEAGSTDENLTFALNLPKDVNRDNANLKINLSPSIAGTLIGAVEYLAGYPYGCVEQTMSRFMPNAVVQSSLAEFGIKNEKLEKELPKMMEKGFARLYNYQHDDGGWGWWKNDLSDPYMTAYVIYGFTLAKKAGYQVSEESMNKGIRWIRENYDKSDDLNTKAYMLFALSQAGIFEKKRLNLLFDAYPKMDNYSQAILAMSLYNSGDKLHAEQILNGLVKKAKVQGTVAYWTGGGRYSWSDNTIETTAYVLKAFVLVKPDCPIVEKAVRYLTVSRQGDSWYSTKDTAAAVLALMDYVKLTGEMNVEFEATLSVNGNGIKKVNFTKKDIAGGGVSVIIPGKDLLYGKNTISVIKKGSGRAYCSALLTHYTTEELIKEKSNGIEVKREYFLVKNIEDKTASTKTVAKSSPKKSRRSYHGGYSKPSEKLIPLNPKGIIELNPQDIVEVVITLDSEGGSRYVMLEDMKPAGCEAEQEKNQNGYWSWWYAQKEFRDEKVVFFMSHLNKGKQVLKYRLRAETPGTYRVLPATASLMYIPQIGGRSNEFIVQIKPEKK